ncbi:MAG: hypothetical protein KDE27_23125 [Planctomycetes bacterium]|nr:hypothetical protein [Planctomycetota bacterium]
MNRTAHAPFPLALALAALALPTSGTAQQPAASAAHLDVILLRNGERFEGRVLTELDGYVEFELEAGSVVGVGRDQVLEIQRGAGAAVATVRAALAPRDEWFSLHDARGAAIGWLHAAIVVGQDGGITVSEEYEFADDGRRYQVTSQCTADARLAPQGCYFRERISEPMLAIAAAGEQDRIVGERIVDARRRGDALTIVRADGDGRRERTLDWPAGATFPLLARIAASATGAAIEDAPMFDPATEEFAVRSVAGGRLRSVTVAGQEKQVTELVESGANMQNSVWLDASLHTVRREINGPALVAVPSDAESAKARVGHARIAEALAREADGAFGLWIPNPAWRAAEELDPGQIALHCDAHDATIALTRIDHLDPGTHAVVAADAVSNWFRLLHPALKIVARENLTVRDRSAIRLRAEGRERRSAVRATVDVIPHGEQFLVLVCFAPARAWEELQHDFDLVLRTAELEPDSVEPRLQGPVLERLRRQEREQEKQKGRGSEPRREAPIVRIPNDG